MQTKSTIPSGLAEGALTSYIHTATLCTVDLETYRQFYGEAMKMQIDGPLPVSAEEKAAQKSLWNIPNHVNYDLYHFHRATVPSLIHLRVLHLKTPTPHIHKSYNSYELGSFSLGFPTSDAKGMDARMKKYDVGAMAPMQLGDIENPDGSIRQYLETIYQGPDWLHCVGIERVKQTQLAPCDPADGFGGPGYSAFVAKDSDAEIAFYLEVLEHNLVFDTVWEAAEGGALGIPAGVPFRFTGIYAPGSKQNHFLMLDFKDGNAVDTGVQSCVPNQGLGMYTFQTSDIYKVIENAKAKGIKILSEVREVSDSILGKGKACLLETPNEFYVEIFQKKLLDKILKRFTEVLCGTLDNQAQIDEERAAGKQIHPYAKHVTEVCDHKIINRPADHEGIYILEESYYIYPDKEMEIKPLFFYVRSDGHGKALLQSVQVPERLEKSEVTNDNKDLVFDFNELTIRPFGVAEYTLHEEGHFTVNHKADMGDGLTFQLIETLSDEGLQVMELVHKNGVKLTPYDTPILYKKINS